MSSWAPSAMAFCFRTTKIWFSRRRARWGGGGPTRRVLPLLRSTTKRHDAQGPTLIGRLVLHCISPYSLHVRGLRFSVAQSALPRRRAVASRPSSGCSRSTVRCHSPGCPCASNFKKSGFVALGELVVARITDLWPRSSHFPEDFYVLAVRRRSSK